MTDETARFSQAPVLTDLQQSRREFARRDLDAIRTEDLAQMPPADLILHFERVRSRLEDMLSLVDEIAGPQAPPA